MPQIWTGPGANFFGLRWAASLGFVGGDWNFRLFQNAYSPTWTSLVSNFVQATFPGYASIPATAPPVATQAGTSGVLSWVQMTWTLTANISPQIVYGYYVTNPGGTHLYFAERFLVPFTLQHTGDAIQVSPITTMFSQYPM